MNLTNKQILQKANEEIIRGNNEGFLHYCTDDTTWTFVGDQTLNGKEDVRQYMAIAYIEPPKFTIDHMIAEGDYVTAIGKISMKNDEGQMTDYAACDVWKFRDGKMAGLKAFVIPV